MPGSRELTACSILNLTFSPLFSNTPSDSLLTGLKIDHVNIAVKDLDAAKRQYKKLGGHSPLYEFLLDFVETINYF